MGLGRLFEGVLMAVTGGGGPVSAGRTTAKQHGGTFYFWKCSREGRNNDCSQELVS